MSAGQKWTIPRTVMRPSRPITASRQMETAPAVSQIQGFPLFIQFFIVFIFLEGAVLFTESLTHNLSDSVKEEGEDKQYQRCQEQYPVVGAIQF